MHIYFTKYFYNQIHIRTLKKCYNFIAELNKKISQPSERVVFKERSPKSFTINLLKISRVDMFE